MFSLDKISFWGLHYIEIHLENIYVNWEDENP